MKLFFFLMLMISTSAFAAETDKKLHKVFQKLTGETWFANISILELSCTKKSGMFAAGYSCAFKQKFEFGSSSQSFTGSNAKDLYKALVDSGAQVNEEDKSIKYSQVLCRHLSGNGAGSEPSAYECELL